MAIKLDENLTIGQALELTKNYKGKKTGELKTRNFSPLLKSLKEIGLTTSDKFSVFKDKELLVKLGDTVGGEGAFTSLTSVENDLLKLYNITEDAGEFPLKKKVFGTGGLARGSNIKAADQARLAKKVKLPPIADINKAINRSVLRLVNEGSYEAAGYLLVKHLTGLRSRDIANLTTGSEIKQGAEYGHVKKGSATLLGISNKGEAMNFRLSSMPNGVLQFLAEVADPDGTEKNTRIFKNKLPTLDKKVNTAVRKVFDDMKLDIIDERTGKKIPFTSGLLRKNVFSAIADEHGPDVANRVLGHSTRGDVGLTHYQVSRDTDKLPLSVRAAENFNSIFLNDIGQSSPKEVFGKIYRFGEKNFSQFPLIKFDTPNVIDEAVAKSQINLENKSVGAGVAIENIVEDNEKQIGRLEKQLTKIEKLKTQADQLKGKQKNTQQTVNKEMVDNHNKRIQDLKDKLKGNRLLETAIILGAGAEGVRELFDDPADLIKDVAIDVGTTALLGPTGGLALVESLRPSTAFAAERTGDERPATQEELMRPIEKKELETVADDEKAIQEQMNIRKMGEDFRREAERKSQLSLDEQMQLLNQGR